MRVEKRKEIKIEKGQQDIVIPFCILRFTNVTIVCFINRYISSTYRSDLNPFGLGRDAPSFYFTVNEYSLQSSRNRFSRAHQSGVQPRINTHMNSGAAEGYGRIYRSRTVSSDSRGTVDLSGRRTRLGNVRGALANPLKWFVSLRNGPDRKVRSPTPSGMNWGAIPYLGFSETLGID